MKQNRVLKNATWIIGCKIIQSLLGIIITMLSARYLGPANYGLINYAASVVSFVAPIMQLGLNSILVQEIVTKSEQEGEILGTALLMSFISSFFCILGVIAFVSIVNYNEPTTIIVCALYSVLLIFQALEMMQYWFQAKLKSKYTSIVMLIAYVAMSVYKIVLLATGSDIYWFALSNALDYMIIAFSLLVIYKKIGNQKLSFSWKQAKKLFAKSKHYIISTLMITIFVQADRIMIKLMIGDEAVGYYSAAHACATMTAFVFYAILDSARPTIFSSKQVDIKTFEKNISRLYCVIIYLSLAQCIIISCFAPIIIRILYGVEYLASVPALRVAVWFTMFSFLGSVRNIWILAENKQNVLWFLNFIGVIVNIILNFILIPVWGIVGAAFASFLTEFCINVIIPMLMPSLRKSFVLLLKGLNPCLIIEIMKKIIKKES